MNLSIGICILLLLIFFVIGIFVGFKWCAKGVVALMKRNGLSNEEILRITKRK